MVDKKIIKFYIFFAIVLFLILIILFIGQKFRCQNCQIKKDLEIKEACYQNHCFKVEIADNPFKRTLGLMFQEKMDQDKGMLFIFEEEGIYHFWMKNTLIPLDIIWLNKEKKVVFIEKNVQPCKQIICPQINAEKLAKYVLEINAGLAEKINLNFEDQIIFK